MAYKMNFDDDILLQLLEMLKSGESMKIDITESQKKTL